MGTRRGARPCDMSHDWRTLTCCCWRLFPQRLEQSMLFVTVDRLRNGGGMLWLLLCLLPAPGGCNRVQQTYKEAEERQAEGEVAVTTRPHIYYCRSPNMEVFTCWWYPLTNLTDGEDISYVLTYSKDKGPKRECPDYVSAGAHSCHFDSSHTSIWNYYCMNVTAVTPRQNFTSQEHCLDVAEIVQTEAPVNLMYKLMDPGGDEMGHDVLLSWAYPVPSDLKYGWITLVYELQYRRVSEPDKWKVKESLREPRVKLLGLPNNDYVVRVRCRSHNYGLWSKWSQPILMSIPAQAPADILLVLILVTSISMVALLAIAVRVLPQCARVKDFFLPPIPKPRIIGIDPLLLKKGNLDEINHHLSNFHSYIPPSFMETEVWEQVSPDSIHLATPNECTLPIKSPSQAMDALIVPNDLTATTTHHPPTSQLPMYLKSPYCMTPPQALSPPLAAPSEMVCPTESGMMGQPTAAPAAITNAYPPQDFYSCVQLIDSEALHLVPCLPLAYCQLPPLPKFDLHASVKEEEQGKKLDEAGKKDGSESKESEATPPSVDNTI
ncbi:growth hormone receptor-like isoform X2 [Dunckerocampus dactyliophorus]|uniref:growth hormone receptor-like isoform X2 n=1 Tax=Dunckerocampus dactyliophorus TaxID=161453 RepID=UPI002404DD2C|nr:growth hormone receptor-like isoform X2 [Dunckerocampus dactyliophorus]